METLKREDYDNMHDLLNEYYKEHSKLINKLLDKIHENLKDDFLMLANERNSVYGRDEKLKGE